MRAPSVNYELSIQDLQANQLKIRVATRIRHVHAVLQQLNKLVVATCNDGNRYCTRLDRAIQAKDLREMTGLYGLTAKN